MVNDKRTFFGMEAKIDGHGPDTGFEASKNRFQGLRIVVLENGNVIPLLDAVIVENVGQPVGPFIELCVGVVSFSMNDGWIVGISACGFG